MSSPILRGYLDAILTNLGGIREGGEAELFTYLMCRHDSKVLQHDQNLQLTIVTLISLSLLFIFLGVEVKRRLADYYCLI